MLFAVKNLRASRVNLIMNDFAAGLPSPLSFIGLSDAVARNLGREPWSARVLPVLHTVAVSPGRTKPEMENKSGSFGPIEIMEDLIGTVSVSCLIDLPGHESAQSLKESLFGMRIAGGTLQDEHFQVDQVTPDGSAFQGLWRGYAMLPAWRDDHCRITTGRTEELAEIAKLLFPSEKRPGSGWIIPSAVGYRLIEDPETTPRRTGSRNGEIPHVFVEPVLGTAELVSVRNTQLTQTTRENLLRHFWSWDVRGEYVLGNPAYHPASRSKEKDISNA